MKFDSGEHIDAGFTSHPARGAWIEIVRVDMGARLNNVAPRKGCVD